MVTADGGFRKGKPYMLKPVVDKALKEGCASVEMVCVVEKKRRRYRWEIGTGLFLQGAYKKPNPPKCDPNLWIANLHFFYFIRVGVRESQRCSTSKRGIYIGGLKVTMGVGYGT